MNSFEGAEEKELCDLGSIYCSTADIFEPSKPWFHQQNEQWKMSKGKWKHYCKVQVKTFIRSGRQTGQDAHAVVGSGWGTTPRASGQLLVSPGNKPEAHKLCS